MNTPGHPDARRPATESELRYWLQNMVWEHRFTPEEMTEATGLDLAELSQALTRLNITSNAPPKSSPNGPLRVVPYPGGRHPRIGFLDGAVGPQRETKFSVFTPWDPLSYVVVDLPEAIWSNLGLTYLAHTHIPTVWTKQGKELERLEWVRGADGLESERVLPNGIAFGARVRWTREGVHMALWLRNGSEAALSDLRVQNCVMLKGAPEFNQLSNANKILSKPYAACRSPDGRRWIITAWELCHRPWANAPVPCLHSDPKFLDCAVGQMVRLRGWLSFYEGVDIQGEFERLDRIGWQGRE